jgi:hypothetical protein
MIIPTSLLNRIAVFRFLIDDTVEEPTIEFISEDPYLQYVRTKLLLKVFIPDYAIVNHNDSLM